MNTYQGPLTRSLYWKFIEESRDESADVRVEEVGKSQERKMTASIDDVMNKLKGMNIGGMIKGLEPQSFYGYNTENPREFIGRFEHYAKLNELDGNSKITTFALLLRGLARLWFENLSDGDKTTWQNVKTKFETKFTDNTQKWISHQMLDSRKQRPEESVENYLAEILTLADRLKMTEPDIMQAIIRGLQPALKGSVIMFNPTTLDELQTRLLLGEQAMKLQNGDKRSISSMESSDELAVLMKGINVKLDDLSEKCNSNNQQMAEEPTPQMKRDGDRPHQEGNQYDRDDRLSTNRSNQRNSNRSNQWNTNRSNQWDNNRSNQWDTNRSNQWDNNRSNQWNATRYTQWNNPRDTIRNNQRRPWNASNVSTNGWANRCYNCDRVGHLARSCWFRHRGQGQRYNYGDGRSSASHDGKHVLNAGDPQ